MERLTKHSKQTSHENGICCTHFRGPECLEVGGNCAMNCKWEEAAWSRLAAYEDTRLTPEEIDMDHEAAEELRQLCQGCDLDRLEELAEADRAGRLMVSPCKVGDTVWVTRNPWTGKLLKKTIRCLRQWREDVFPRDICEFAFRYPQNQRDEGLRDQPYWQDRISHPRGGGSGIGGDEGWLMLIACVAALGMRTTGTVLRSAGFARRSQRRTARCCGNI